MADRKTIDISLGENVGDVAVKVNGVRIEVGTDRSVRVYTNSSVDAYTNGTVNTHPAATEYIDERAGIPQVGKKMPDGTVYAGISPTTGKPMYAAPVDAPLSYTFNKALRYAENLDAYGHRDWHAPTNEELNVLFRNRAAIGGFNETGSILGGWYWSSSQTNDYRAWSQRFSDGDQNDASKYADWSLRCVR